MAQDWPYRSSGFCVICSFDLEMWAATHAIHKEISRAFSLQITYKFARFESALSHEAYLECKPCFISTN